MKRQLQGISLVLLSIMLILGFNSVGIKYVFGLDLEWTHIIMVVGIIGAVMTFLKDKKER